MKITFNPVRTLYRESSRSTCLLFGTALVSLVFGFWGWYSLRDTLCLSIGDVIYRSIAALTLSVPYHSGAAWGYDWRLETARWAGLLALIIGAGKTAFLLLESQWREMKAGRKQGHWLVIGNSPFAERLSQAARLKKQGVNWLAAPASQANTHIPDVFQEQAPWSIERALALGLDRARGVIVAMDDDALTHSVAREIRAAVPDETRLSVMASIGDPWLAMRIDEVDRMTGITVFSETQIAVRQLLRKHPPFLFAHQRAQARIHMVLVDFSSYAEAMMIETLVMCLTDLARPRFTIIDPDAQSIRQDLLARYPELTDSADLRFIEGRINGRARVLAPEIVTKLVAQEAVTYYCACNEDDAEALTTGIVLQAVLRKYATSVAPVMIRVSSTRTLPTAQRGTSGIVPGQLIGFGALDDLAGKTGLFTGDLDRLAKQFHEEYQQAAGEKSENKPWEQLDEDTRDANRRLAAHIPAKLHCMGIDVEQWMMQVDRNPDRLTLPTASGLLEKTDLIERIAILEHRRWMADRRINGWVHGNVDANEKQLRRIHKDLVPYEELSEESKTFDRNMVRKLMRLLER